MLYKEVTDTEIIKHSCMKNLSLKQNWEEKKKLVTMLKYLQERIFITTGLIKVCYKD